MARKELQDQLSSLFEQLNTSYKENEQLKLAKLDQEKQGSSEVQRLQREMFDMKQDFEKKLREKDALFVSRDTEINRLKIQNESLNKKLDAMRGENIRLKDVEKQLKDAQWAGAKLETQNQQL